MEKKYDVTALGELLIDFAVNGESEQGNQLFEACPGGAPCNVLAMLNKLGRKTAFIGKVGDDQFGKLLKDTITNTGIEAKGLVMDQDIHTTLNLRPPLWKTLDEAKEQMEYGFENCDVLKISDNEIQFVSGEEDYDKGIKYLQEKYQIPLIFLTMGKEGSRAYYKNLRVEQPGFTVKAIETTGAGDTFCGCSINGVLKYGLDNLDEEKLKEILTYANAGAALITMKKGAIRSMPEPQNIKELIGE